MLRCSRCLTSSIRTGHRTRSIGPRLAPDLASSAHRLFSTSELDIELNKLLGIGNATTQTPTDARVPAKRTWEKRPPKIVPNPRQDGMNTNWKEGKTREGRSQDRNEQNASPRRPREHSSRGPKGFGMRSPNTSSNETIPNEQKGPESRRRNAPTPRAQTNSDEPSEPLVAEEDDASSRRNRSPSKGPAKTDPRKDKKTKGRGSVHSNRTSTDPTPMTDPRKKQTNSPEVSTKPKIQKVQKKQEIKVEKEVYIPPISVKVGDLARMVDVRLPNLQQRMRRMGMTEEQCHSDNYLMSEDASLVAMEFGFNPIVDEERSFDIYPEPIETDTSSLPLRPPVVTIMGHVDHGKTTLLDSLRHTSVASGEAGGITQHIGAFSVPLSSLTNSAASSDSSVKSITFLDTPGHAAFTGMRARGASVTDIVVLVVAADDGVMPQTKEVIDLVKKSGVGLVVAINKCDKPGLDFHRVKSALGTEQIHLEEDGGDVPSVRVSGLKGEGLDTLVETLGVLAEVRDLRAKTEGRGEGWVLESRVERGRGNSATILVTRGTLQVGSIIIAGTTWCKIRQMMDDKNQPIKSASPGMPVTVTGWKDLPLAGDQILQPPTPGHKAEDEAKRAVANRLRYKERQALMADVEVINEKRRIERERQVEEETRLEAIKAEGGDINAAIRSDERKARREDDERGTKELRLIIRADVSGTVEAVVGSLEGIGNNEVGTKIIHTGVGDVTDSDVAMAEASEATIIGFSVKAARSVENLAASKSVPLHLESVIYRLIETVRQKVSALLPPIIETRVTGEATVLQIFTIAVKGQKDGQVVAGCRIGNGLISKGDTVRVLRGEKREVVFEGPLESLRHLKKEVNEARKGSECGMTVTGYRELQEGDQIVAVQKLEKQQQL